MMLWSNPEFIRNVRAQLRGTRMVTMGVICALVSITLAYYFYWQRDFSRLANKDLVLRLAGSGLLSMSLWIQTLVLAAGGSIVCVNSIYKEKDQNSFDFQRITRLTPFQLTVGKLFGAPAMMYFICLCFLPLAIFAAILAKVQLSFFVAAYLTLLVGSLSFHIFSLLVSLLTFRGSHTSAIVLVVILLWAGGYPGRMGDLGAFRLGMISPFLAPTLALEKTWNLWQLLHSSSEDYYVGPGQGMVAYFFGHPIHQFFAFLLVTISLSLWFLLGILRNIKRDPDYYEVYSPLQAFGFSVYFNFLLLAFFRWTWSNAIDSQSFLLTMNILIITTLGFFVFRNREKMRRALRNASSVVEQLQNSLWPLPILLTATVFGTVMITAGLTMNHPANDLWLWEPRFTVLRSLFFVLWIVRDLQFLQWMNLRRGKYPLVLGFVFLAIFYVLVNTMLTATGCFDHKDRQAYTALFVPSPLFLLDGTSWPVNTRVWVAGFVLQPALVLLFLWLQSRELKRLAPEIAQENPAVVTA